MTPESWHKGTSAPSLRKDEARHWLGSLLFVKERVPFIHKVSLLEQVKEENHGGDWLTLIHLEKSH